ncbi:histidine phosphatase superfamily [Colletotrichum cereale]|nr:histidine phosphatase superfamily [Colletotrichum cereale]
MVASSLVLLAGALPSTTTSAQSSNPSVWASVAMVMHGERTPLRSELQNTLTPQGAQQLYAQGDAFRSRYLTSGTRMMNVSEGRITSHVPIQGMARNVLQHEQLAILSVPDSHVVASANAFMQGLYPPITMAFSADTGGTNISYSTLTGNSTQYPLDGYQYPLIETLGLSDERSVAVRGNTECPQWRVSTTTAMQLDPSMKKLYEDSLPGYQSLFGTPPLNDGVIPLSSANFWDAYNLQQYVSYRYSHEQAIYDAMEAGYAQQSDFLMTYARQQQLNMTSNKAVSGLQTGDMIRTIAGRTLAQKVVDAFRANSNYAGASSKMTLMFSSQEPFLSFFSLAQLQQGEPTPLNPFWNIPQNGAAMVFELIGDKPDDDDANAYPTEDNLYVRFMYRENADPGTPFKEYALFGLGDAEPRPSYSRFKQEMLKFGVDVSAWCTICGSAQPFCQWRAANTQPTVGEAILSAVQRPVVAGIIGALIVLAVLGLAGAAATFLGGFRIHRQGKPGTGLPRMRRESRIPILFAGFKMAEKMASDMDLSVSKRGVHHERHGSWELRDGHAGAGMGKSTWSFRNKSIDEGSINGALGAAPVGPKEHV